MQPMNAIGILLMGLSASVPGLADQPGSMDRLAWLSGTWGSEEDGRWTEEHWIAPRGGLMLGVNRTGNVDQAQGFEFLRIQAESDGTITYWAMPGGEQAVPFRLTRQDEHSVLFENPQHDFPAQISYQREGDTLEVSIAGPGGAGMIRWRWTRL